MRGVKGRRRTRVTKTNKRVKGQWTRWPNFQREGAKRGFEGSHWIELVLWAEYVYPAPNSYAEAASTSATVSGGGPLRGNCIYIRWSPHVDSSVLISRGTRVLSPSARTKERWACEHTMSRQLSATQEEGSHQMPNLPVPQSWTSEPPALWELNPPSLRYFVIAAWAKAIGKSAIFFQNWLRKKKWLNTTQVYFLLTLLTQHWSLNNEGRMELCSTWTSKNPGW